MVGHIVVLNLPNLEKSRILQIQGYSNFEVLEVPEFKSEYLPRFKNAEVLLTSLYIKIDQEFLSRCPNLKYIGVYGTTLSNVDLHAVKERGIAVKNLTKYCDFESAEFIIMEILLAARKLGSDSWGKEKRSLFGKKLGIVGMGSIGSQVARIALSLKMEVYYNSLTRKKDLENLGCHFADKPKSLQQCEFISFHTPPFTYSLTAEEFQKMNPGKTILSICQGYIWEAHSIHSWLDHLENRLILDQFAYSQLTPEDKAKFSEMSNVRISPIWAYDTVEMRERISQIFCKVR